MKAQLLLCGIFALVFLLFSSATSDKNPASNSLTPPVSISEEIGLPFVQNDGLMDSEVLYFVDIAIGRVLITKNGIVYPVPPADHSAEYGAVLERFRIGSEYPAVVSKSETNVSYFLGNDPSKWKSSVPTAKVISLGEVFSGIELSLIASSSNIEKIFTVSPGGNPDDIRIPLLGPNKIQPSPKGTLRMQTGPGAIEFSEPVAFQEIDGKQTSVPVSYRMIDEFTYGFQISSADYRSDLPLTIDPIVQSTYFGGAGTEDFGAVLYHNGSVYIAGRTNSSSIPGTAGGYQANSGGSNDGFISKLNPSLTAVVQTTYLGGNKKDGVGTIVAGPNNELYVAGLTSSQNFPGMNASSLQQTYGGGIMDYFITRLSSDLTSMIQSTYLGGSSGEFCPSLIIDEPAGVLYLGGYVSSPDYPGIGSGSAQSIHAGGTEDFAITRLGLDLTNQMPAGTFISTYVGGSGDDELPTLMRHPSGDLYLVGHTTTSSGFPGIDGNSAQSTFGGGQNDLVAVQVSANLDQIIQATYIGGSGNEDNQHSVMDAAGQIYTAARTTSINFPSTSSGCTPNYLGGTSDLVVVKMTSLTSAPVATYAGGNKSDADAYIALGANQVYIAGKTNSKKLFGIRGATGLQAVKKGSNDFFLARFDLSLANLNQFTFLGGTGVEYEPVFTFDGAGNMLFMGQTTSADFPGVSGGAQSNHAGGVFDLVVSKLSNSLE